MVRLLILAAVIVLGWKLVVGRWPWQKKLSTRSQAQFQARQLLGVSAEASREEIVGAHRRLVALVHPDRGGSNAQVHEANAARDLLLGQLPYDPQETP